MTRDLPARTDLVVIGGGILGTLTAFLVARAGVDVVLLERGAMFREASGVNAGGLAIQTTVPDITPDAVASVATWSRMADDLGADVGFVRTGGFRVATSEKEVAELLEAMPRLAALGLTMQWHGGNEVRHNLPWLGPGIMGASYCAEEAFAVPMLAGAALKNAAVGAGARVHEHTAVTGLTPVGELVQVHTAGGDIAANRVLIAGGAWIASIARMLGVEIPLLLKTFMLTVTERAPPIMGQLVTHARRNLTMKQFRNGTCVIGGGWPGVGSVSPVRKDIDVDVLARNLRHALSVVPRLGDVPGRAILGGPGGRDGGRVAADGGAAGPSQRVRAGLRARRLRARAAPRAADGGCAARPSAAAPRPSTRGASAGRMCPARRPPKWFTEPRMFRHVGGGPEVRFLLDGVERTAIAGQSVAAALLALGEGVFRHAPESGAPRGPYCLMGVCFECMIEIDGARRQACLAPIADGMRVVRRLG